MKSILIVDDEADIREVYKLELMELDHKIFEASNSKEALTILADEKINLVITDLNMSGGSGEEVIEYVLSQDEKIPCMITTGYLKNVQKYEELGDNFKVYFKPLDFDQILKEIEVLI